MEVAVSLVSADGHLIRVYVGTSTFYLPHMLIEMKRIISWIRVKYLCQVKGERCQLAEEQLQI